MVKKVFTVGELVFAKVKGYPAWPARVTGRTSGGKYSVFFYGTFEVGNMKPEEMWPYNQKFRDRFGPPNMRKKWYPEGLYQIEHTPEIALQQLGLVGEEENVQGGGDLPAAAPPEPVLVKILSSNQMKEICVKPEDLGDNHNQAKPKPRVQCEIGTAENILEAGDSILVSEVTEELKKKVNVVKMDTKERILLKKIEKLEWLKLEQRLVDIVCEIQKCMSQTSPDLAKCVEMLKLMEEVDIKPLMVIKLPEVFMTVRRLSMEWIAGGGDGCLAEQVRERSERLRVKIVQVVSLGKSISLQEFDKLLEKKVKEFNQKTIGLSEKKRLGIINLDNV